MHTFTFFNLHSKYLHRSTPQSTATYVTRIIYLVYTNCFVYTRDLGSSAATPQVKRMPHRTSRGWRWATLCYGGGRGCRRVIVVDLPSGCLGEKREGRRGEEGKRERGGVGSHLIRILQLG